MLLKDSKYLPVEEQLAMFMMVIAHAHTNRVIQDRFQHSGETIHRHFRQVLIAMMMFAKDMIKPPPLDTVPKEILLNPRFEPYFKDCIGALDGTLVHAIIQPEKQIPYRGRKGDCMQQVMAVCSFDMLFTYVVCGWEGTAHDQRILLDTISDEKLKFPHAPPGKYYLVDAGYTNMRGFLSPFRNVRYWLQDFQGVAIPHTREEHFNRLHSSLRNVIERSFGVLKARFPILKRMARYPFPVQRSIAVAAMAMHNFIRKDDMEDQLFAQFSSSNTQVECGTEEDLGENTYTFDITDRIEIDTKRNSIADAIWRDASS
ncbi:putative myb/SANT-like domain-containing protein [Cinnamomum micranthum f. kanehirae]|uniref:Putative myb/SANT-like domain-containing protein n=1 Tax=Cinnamomum micranthum f. kanehirae TaxID=337451 RepID=A0A443PJK0_9MAGN|nr:putative myb/SANT-like domain-containing protein [Cinnamomum micranthum f. kanehirae]